MGGERGGKGVVGAAGGLAAALGALVLAGWYARWAWIVHLGGYNPMLVDTALSFVLVGAGLWALASGRRKLSVVAAVVGSLPAFVTGLEYVLGVELGLHRLVQGWLTPTSRPGHMAPNTVICFLLTGVALACAARRASSPLPAAAGGAVVASLGVVALFGYQTGLETQGWGGRYQMAFLAAAGFVAVGAGLLGWAWREARGAPAVSPRWLSIPIALAVGTVTFSAWRAVLLDDRAHGERLAAAEAAHVRRQIVAAVSARTAALMRLAERWQRAGGWRQPDWEFEAGLVLRDIQGYQALAWVDPEFYARWILPLRGNEPLRDANLAFDPQHRAWLERARQTRGLVLTGPLTLPAGGTGFQVIVPVFHRGVPDGFLVGMFRTQSFLDSVVLPQVAPGYAILIRAAGEEIYRRGRDPAGGGEETVDLHGASWGVRVWPTAEALAAQTSALPEAILVAGLILALLLGVAVHLAQTAHLRTQAAERAERAVRARVRQQGAVAALGQRALSGGDLHELMDEAVQRVRDTLEVELVKVLELLPDGQALLLRAGVGWNAGLVGVGTVGAGLDSQAGFTLLAAEPVIVEDLRAETRFHGPPLLHEHGVVSGMSVVIAGRDRPFGVLGAHSRTRRAFTGDDVHFLHAVANVLAAAIERRRAEQDLDQFFTLSLDLLCLAGLDGYFKRVNTAWSQTLGYTAGELLAVPYQDFVHPEDRERTAEQAAALACGGDVVQYANRYRAKDGSYRWLLWNATALPARNLVFAAARDVTEQRAAQEALRRAHDELELRVRERTAELENANRELERQIRERRRAQLQRDRFFGLSRCLLSVSDLSGNIKSVNPAWARTLGYSPDEMAGRPWAELVHPEDRPAAEREIARLAAGEETALLQNRYRTKDGAWRWLLWNAIPLPAEGEVYAHGRDITELKQAEAALKEREERFRTLFESAPVGIVLCALDGRYLRVNRAFCAMLGYQERELLQMRAGDVAPAQDLGQTPEHAAEIAGGAIATFRIEKRYIRKDGTELWVDLTTALIRGLDSAPLYTVSVVQDVTGRRLREEEIGKLNRELSSSVAELTAVNKELEAFTYSISHDLRAPLRHIDGFSKLLLEEAGPALEEGARRWLDRVREGSQQMGRMIDDLLNLSRTGRREPNKVLTGLNGLLQEALAELQPECEDRQVEWRIGELPFADCDPPLVRQVFFNLLSNALKFTRTRPRAIIEVGQAPGEDPPAIFVRDNGVGFSMRYAHKLFGVFQRLHRREDFEGTGVGLATAQRIVAKHGGRIWAQAELDKGATFYFTLEGAAARSLAAAEGGKS